MHCKPHCVVSLMEMLLFLQSNEQGGEDEVEAFPKQVMPKTSVIISATGDAIAIFKEVQSLTPRYDMRSMPTFSFIFFTFALIWGRRWEVDSLSSGFDC